MLGVTGEFSLSASDGSFGRSQEENAIAVVQLLGQTSASMKLANVMPRRTIDQSPTSSPKNRRAVIAKGAVLPFVHDLLETIEIVFCAPIAFMLPSVRIANSR
jgi:hypothetical protein